MGTQLQHDSNGGPCSRCGLTFSSKTAYMPCFEEGDTLATWVTRHRDIIAANAEVFPQVVQQLAEKIAQLIEAKL